VVIPQEAYLLLSVFALIVMIIRIANSIRSVNARKTIFGAGKEHHKAGMISNIGYAIVLMLLSMYFLLLYFKAAFAGTVFVVMLFALLIALIVDAAYRKRR
jgi:UDP-N-acetylmuramyl pentapeptide phosphotransferase/UDP-N-acetylglucosamine-1-phosphate transferase